MEKVLSTENTIKKKRKRDEKEKQRDEKENSADTNLGEEKNTLGSFGIFIHYGLYAVPGFDCPKSAEKRPTQNGSEWYLKRLETDAKSFRPTSGWRETKEYHTKTFGNRKYDDFKKDLKIPQFDEWMQLFQEVGASYVVLTTKHHDGFCLWETKTKNEHVEGDWLQSFKESAQKHGLKFGFYYSWMEFRRASKKSYLEEVVKPQISELIQYQPDLFWFDGDWTFKTKIAQQTIDDCLDLIKQSLPNVEINDRIGHKEERKNKNWLGGNTYRSYEDRFIPKTKPAVPFETCQTIGLSWGYNAQQKEEHYKSADKLVDLYQRVVRLNGRLLLNLGPKADGSLCQFEVDRLRTFGAKIK